MRRHITADEPALNVRGAPRGGSLTRRRFISGAGSTVALAGTGTLIGGCAATPSPPRVQRVLALPQPRQMSAPALREVLTRRRSKREFAPQALGEQEIGELLWAAQGITADWGGRTSPSAGALYPLELYVVTPNTYGHYRPHGHLLEELSTRDLRRDVSAAALGQPALRAAPLTVVFTAVYARTMHKYGARGRRYVELEAGHAAQNVLLQAVALGLAAVPMGAFDDRRLAHTLQLPPDHTPLYLVAAGHPRPTQPA